MTRQTSIEARFKLQRPGNCTNFCLEINQSIPGQGVTAIFGQSGSGKTSLLRCIAGLDRPQQGLLSVAGELWQQDSFFVPPHKRQIGYVFQDAGLFDHLSAKANLDYAIKRAWRPFDRNHYEQILDVLDIAALLNRRPAYLSGGECQRVAIARALLVQPRLLLMDEPMASLDPSRKAEILPYLEQLKEWLGIPVLYVSHSLNEVSRLADQVMVMDQGKVMALGDPAEIFSQPGLQPAQHNEAGVILEGQVCQRDEQWHLCKITLDNREFWVPDSGEQLHQRVRLQVLARDVSVALKPHEDTSILNRIEAEITELIPAQNHSRVLVRMKIGAQYLLAQITRKSAHQLNIKPGMTVWAQVKSVAIVR